MPIGDSQGNSYKYHKKAKKFTLFSFVEFCLWNALDDMTNFQRNFSTGEVEIDGSVIYHKTEYRAQEPFRFLYCKQTDIRFRY